MRCVMASAAILLVACGADAPATQTAPAPEAPAPATAAPIDASALHAGGWGPLTIGMSRDDVVAALGEDANPDAVGGPDPDSCDMFYPANAPEGLLVMIEQGRLTRISLVNMSEVKTADGFGLGDAASDVAAAFSDRALITPHKYQGPPAQYITVWQGGARSEPYVQDESARGIVYEIDGTGHVGMIHAGGPSIQYVEGCA